ncbi:hypothetical protein N0V93_001972 [Gnomoniopsis smithogilvyi]|uniref:Major facilitator superfamily (MFS) profile domain-containing protein n=1 Tax=Gnomoniopsis smithogilvyi TaxID=1191159 RepID=A0A9W8Z6Y4_9PEZI|nr:hypothetical protein N0V93_001972 [Gnomoniopsis smithogilvyi]
MTANIDEMAIPSATVVPADFEQSNNGEVLPVSGLANANIHETKDTTMSGHPASSTHKGYRFWAIILALCITGLLGALENTVVTTSLPTIVDKLALDRNYIWVTNIFFLTSAAVQPLFGQLANIFGRRWLTMFIVAVYTLGSGICGGANSGAMLIAGRAVQGIGSGGVNMIVDVIVSDLVPLRERGNYIAIILTVYAIGTSIGPFVGGIIVERTTWRWVFWINLPVGGVALVVLFLFLRVSSAKEMTLLQKMKRIDFVGNAMIMASSVAILYALTYGGSLYSWSNARVVVPLVLGLVGLVLFLFFEGSNWVREPVTPVRLFTHRTGAIVGINTFLNSALLYWAMFFLPVYFQAVLGSSPAWSGVQLLPIVLVAVPGAIIAVIILTKFGRYKHLHVVGFALVTLSLGLFSLLDQHSSTAEWVIFQIIGALGSGMILNTLLPAFQAGIPESDQAAATASWAFIRSFGNIWGVAIPAAIFNNRFQSLSYQISNSQVRSDLSGGNAYEHASHAFIESLPEPARTETVGVYVEALKLVWYISVVFCGLACLLALFEAEIELRKELDTAYGMEDSLTVDKKERDTEKNSHGS